MFALLFISLAFIRAGLGLFWRRCLLLWRRFIHWIIARLGTVAIAKHKPTRCPLVSARWGRLVVFVVVASFGGSRGCSAARASHEAAAVSSAH
jgi:hypothetical protein